MNLKRLWNEISATRKGIGNEISEILDDSLREFGPRMFCVVDESTGDDLWGVTVTQYASRTGRRPRIDFPVVEGMRIEKATIRERKAGGDVILRMVCLDDGDQAAVSPTCDGPLGEIYNELWQAELALKRLLWPENYE